MTQTLPTEILLLGWSVVLLIAYILAQAMSATAEAGLAYNASPRDEERKSGVVAGRLKRALTNFSETYPAFVGLALALALTGRAGGIGATGAWVWMIARALYLPAYGLGIPYVRSLIWAASIVGLVMMLARLLW